MANYQQLEIIGEGVEKWNEWRKSVALKRPNFHHAPLSGANLSGADFSGADFSKADLSNADLSGANFSKADLSNADLSNAVLREAILSKAILYGAVLSGAVLSGADLSGAVLGGADLNKVDLSGANLLLANLANADLREADLREADLTLAELSMVKLNGANLSGAKLLTVNLTLANLSKANLSNAILYGATITSADLREAHLNMSELGTARLINTKLDGAALSGARLWETLRAGWSIKDVICDYVYWDEKGVEKSFYRPGEFERLFSNKTTVRLFYKDCISPLEIATIPTLIRHLEDSHPGTGLRLVSIHEDSGGIVAELAIEGVDNKTPEELQQLKATLEAEAQQRVQYQREALAERETRLKVEGRLEELRSCFHLLASKNQVNVQGDYMGDTHQNYGQTSGMGRNVHAHDNTFNQVVNHFEKSIDLSELAKQLGELRQAMSERQDSSPQTAIVLGKIAEAEIAAEQKNPSKVMESLKAAGQWTLDFAKDVGKDLAVEAIKLSMGMP
jgi:uncharacterized protein YjbI with pentapeptide repeats